MIEKRRPQDGPRQDANPAGDGSKFALSPAHRLRRKVVMRIFDPDRREDLDAGFSARDDRALGALTARPHWHRPGDRAHRLRQDHHAVFDAAPRVATDEGQRGHRRKIPSRKNIEPAFNQTRCSQLDFGFAEGLRALMRQDPDVIMVGEIRDLEPRDGGAGRVDRSPGVQHLTRNNAPPRHHA